MIVTDKSFESELLKLFEKDITDKEIKSEIIINALEYYQYKMIEPIREFIRQNPKATYKEVDSFYFENSIHGTSLWEYDMRAMGFFEEDDLLYNADREEGDQEYYYDREEHKALIQIYIKEGLISEETDTEMFDFYIENALIR